jgi:hypothetical protein
VTAAPDVDDWEPWSPAEVLARLDGVAAPWCVVGGWALDLWAGRQSRPHEDLEIAVPAARFAEVRERLADCELFVPEEGELQPLDHSAEQLRRSHQTWVCHGGRWRLDVMREPHVAAGPEGVGDLWVCRRDETLRLPYADVIRRTADGVPYLRPDLVLLFKAKARRAKDVDDFDRAVPVLSAAERRGLADLIGRAHGSQHPWVASLQLRSR